MKISPLKVTLSPRSAIVHGLVAAGQVDDAQPDVAQADRAVDVDAVFVGPAMRQRREHSPHEPPGDVASVEMNDAGNSAHGKVPALMDSPSPSCTPGGVQNDQ